MVSPLDSVVAAPMASAILLDFDGTLSPIVVDPAAAIAAHGVESVLRDLAGRVGLLAAISGRPIEFLSSVLPATIDLYGVYGLEWRAGGVRGEHDDGHVWREVISDVYEDGAARFGPDAVENKGISLTVHYRADPGTEAELSEWAHTMAERTELDVRSARMSFELHPPVDIDKGSVVELLARDHEVVVYAGDDLGDLPAFDALDRLEERGVTVQRIVVASAGSPAAILERADLVVDGPDGMVEVLAATARALAPPGPVGI